MSMSVGSALAEGKPVVFTGEGKLPEVVCEEGKEKDALELLVKMDIIKLMRPVRKSVPE
jgi:hypothetical protein